MAVLRAGMVLAGEAEASSGMAARALVLMIEQALERAGMTLASLDAIAVGCGPGGFTSLRIAVSVAQALGFAANVPVYGVSTLAAMAYGERKRGGRIVAMMNVGKGEIIWQPFGAEPFMPLAEPLLGTAPVLLPGDVVAERPADAEAVARLALAAPQLLMPAQPLYARPPDAKAVNGG